MPRERKKEEAEEAEEAEEEEEKEQDEEHREEKWRRICLYTHIYICNGRKRRRRMERRKMRRRIERKKRRSKTSRRKRRWRKRRKIGARGGDFRTSEVGKPFFCFQKHVLWDSKGIFVTDT